MLAGAVQQYHGRTLFQVCQAITFGRLSPRSQRSDMIQIDGKLQEKGNVAGIIVVYST